MAPKRKSAIDLSKIETISLNLPDVIGIKAYISQDEEDIIIEAVPTKYYPVTTLYPECPHCHSDQNVSVAEKNRREVHDVQYWGARCTLQIDTRYFYCSKCQKKFVTPFESFGKHIGVTNRLAKKLCTKSVDLIPFSYLAEEYGLDEKTIRNVVTPFLKDQISHLKVELPTVLGMDEDHLHVLSGKKKDMCFVLTNPVTVEILDILESRKKETLEQYFSKFPLDKRLKVKVITMDMWEPYREVSYKFFPNAKIVADRFHVQKNVNKAMNDIRKAVFKQIKEKAKNDPTLKNNLVQIAVDFSKFRVLLLRNYDNLSKEQSEILFKWLGKFPELLQAYTLKEIWRLKIYKSQSRSEAIAEYRTWVEKIPKDSLFDPYRELVVKSVDNWFSEVFNYFDFGGTLTNNPTESLNQVIKRNMRVGNGYSFEILRAKSILGSQKRHQRRMEKQTAIFEKQRLREEKSLLQDSEINEEDYLIDAIASEPDEIDEYINYETKRKNSKI